MVWETFILHEVSLFRRTWILRVFRVGTLFLLEAIVVTTAVVSMVLLVLAVVVLNIENSSNYR